MGDGATGVQLVGARLLMDKQDHPPVAVRPPILFGGALVLAAILEALVPLGPGFAGGNLRSNAVGLLIAVLGAALFGLAVSTFLRAGTNVPTRQPTLALVEHGPYRISRNPIYIAMTLFYFGLATVFTSVWALLFLPVILGVIHYGVVLREEAYLTQKFGAAYASYQARVPRWL